MSKFLDKLFESKDCIDEPDEAERVIEDMANCRLYEISPQTAKLGENLLKYVFLPTDEGGSLRYAELAGLLRVLCCDQSSSDHAAHLRTVLINKNVSCIEAKMFKMVTLKAFTDFIDRKTGTARGSTVYKRVRRIAEDELDFTIYPHTTFDHLFNAFNNRLSSWNIDCTLDVHAKKTAACCQIAKLLLIDCFRFTYSEYFLLGALKKRLVEAAEFWDKGAQYEEWYGTEDENISKYDKVDQFGDDYDTEAEETPDSNIRKYRGNNFQMTEEERMSWDEIRFGILKKAAGG